MPDPEWVTRLGDELVRQLEAFTEDPELKASLHKFLGVLLRKVTDDGYVQLKLDHMFKVCDHENEVGPDRCHLSEPCAPLTSPDPNSKVDQRGLAQGYGFCATQHFEQVMGKIGMVMKNDLVQKTSGGFFGFGGRTGEHPKAALMRSSLLLCFGWITVYSSGDCSLVADQAPTFPDVLSAVAPLDTLAP